MGVGNKIVRALLFLMRFLQFASAVVVTGVMAYLFAHNSSKNHLTMKYIIVIVRTAPPWVQAADNVSIETPDNSS